MGPVRKLRLRESRCRLRVFNKNSRKKAMKMAGRIEVKKQVRVKQSSKQTELDKGINSQNQINKQGQDQAR